MFDFFKRAASASYHRGPDYHPVKTPVMTSQQGTSPGRQISRTDPKNSTSQDAQASDKVGN